MLVPIVHENGCLDEVDVPSNTSPNIVIPTLDGIVYYHQHHMYQRNYFNDTAAVVNVYVSEKFYEGVKWEFRNEMVQKYLETVQLYLGSYGKRQKCL
jgi:hypothetical protein